MNQFLISLITTFFIGGIAGYLGSLMLTKRMALVGGPLGHLALPGVALALIFNFNILWGAFATIFLGIIIIWGLEIKTKIPTEALTGVIFSAGVALGLLFLPMEHAEQALIGDVANIARLDMILSIIFSILVFIIVYKIYLKFILISISNDLAKAEGINPKVYNFIYLMCIAFVITLEVKIVGTFLPVALVAIPASAAKNFSKNLKQYSFISLILGALSGLVGILIYRQTGLPAGPLIILTATFFFLVSLLCKKA
ncbi:MAG: metal ABC transporter permease [Minisyncoccales bacterium]